MVRRNIKPAHSKKFYNEQYRRALAEQETLKENNGEDAF